MPPYPQMKEKRWMSPNKPFKKWTFYRDEMGARVCCSTDNPDKLCQACKIAKDYYVYGAQYGGVPITSSPNKRPMTQSNVPAPSSSTRPVMRVATTVRMAELSDVALRNALDSMLYSIEPAYVGILEVKPKSGEVIYTTSPNNEIILYRRTFTVANDQVTLNDDRVQVKIVTEYRNLATGRVEISDDDQSNALKMLLINAGLSREDATILADRGLVTLKPLPDTYGINQKLDLPLNTNRKGTRDIMPHQNKFDDDLPTIPDSYGLNKIMTDQLRKGRITLNRQPGDDDDLSRFAPPDSYGLIAAAEARKQKK